MVRKRELTVEIWQRKLDEQRKRLLEAPFEVKRDFVVSHAGEPLGLASAAYEYQSMQLWTDGGMQVYDFDRDFTESLLDEKWADLLPDCIGNRPCDSFYMKLPFNDTNEGCIVNIVPSERIDGFQPSWFPGCGEKGVHVGGRKGNERAVVNTGEELLCLCSYAIPRRFEWMTDDTELGNYPTDLVVNGVAYLCSVNADIVPVYTPNRGVKRNNAKRRSLATWSEVGCRIGSELRAYKRYESERKPYQGGTVRPHMRRAHWHHYWIGPRDGDRKLVLKWIPPTMVGVGKEIKSPTVHLVKARA